MAPFHSVQAQDYFSALNDTMNVKALLINRSFNTSLRNMSGEESSLNFAPNSLNYAGVGWYFWGIGVKVHFPLPLSWFYDRADNYNSSVLDIRGTLFRKKWLFDVGFQWYQNLYLSDAASLISDPSEIAATGVEAIRFNTSVTYLFSGERISVKAPFNRNNVQLRNAGTWMLTGGYSYIRLRGEESVVPQVRRNSFGADTTITQISANSFFIRPGYAYNFLYRDFFVHGAASVGMALQDKYVERQQNKTDRWGVAPVYDFRAAIGYDNGKYFAGVSSVFTFGYIQMGDIRLQEQARNTELFVGMRFPEPDWIRKHKPGFLNWFSRSKK